MCIYIYIYISHSLFSTTRSMAGHTGTPPWVTMCMNDRTVQPRRFLADNSRIWQRSFCAQTLPLWQLWGDSSQKAWHRLCRTHRRWSPSPKTTGNTVITGNTWICRKRGFKKNHGKFPEIPGWKFCFNIPSQLETLSKWHSATHGGIEWLGGAPMVSTRGSLPYISPLNKWLS